MAAPLASATASVAAESTGTTISRRDVESLIRQVISPQLYNRQLSSICQVNGLKSTGVKADLQRRITDRESKTKLTSPSLYPHRPFYSSPPSPYLLNTLILIFPTYTHTTYCTWYFLSPLTLSPHQLFEKPSLSTTPPASTRFARASSTQWENDQVPKSQHLVALQVSLRRTVAWEAVRTHKPTHMEFIQDHPPPPLPSHSSRVHFIAWKARLVEFRLAQPCSSIAAVSI